MHSIYVDKNIPRVLITKAIAPLWSDFVWMPLSAARAGILDDAPLPASVSDQGLQVRDTYGELK